MKISTSLFIIFIWCHSIFSTHAVTHETIDTRFGDQLLNYLHAKWISYYYEIPLFYHPFPYSDALALDQKEARLQSGIEKSYQQAVLTDFTQPGTVSNPTLFICPYFAETEYELQNCEYCFAVNWRNEEFRKMALEMIAPKKPVALNLPPQNQINIALHIREGGGYDSPLLRVNFPIKSPPLIFYIESLLAVIEYFPETPLYCRIFTDAKQPKRIADHIARMMPQSAQIIFDYRKEENAHNKNVLEDFFSLFHYDVLIRPGSNFSIIPSLLHDYAILCYPLSFSIKDSIVTIDEYKLVCNKEVYQSSLERLSLK